MSARAGHGEITALLERWSHGDRAALDDLVPIVYAELRRMAARQLRRERGGSFDPTDLVHALFVQLVGQRRAQWQNRAQFFATAAQMMRRILVDYARARIAAKRGGSTVTVSLSGLAQEPFDQSSGVADVLALDRLLERLAQQDPAQARIVELRFFGGLSVEEVAQLLDVSPRTIKREWRTAKAWLFRALHAGAKNA